MKKNNVKLDLLIIDMQNKICQMNNLSDGSDMQTEFKRIDDSLNGLFDDFLNEESNNETDINIL